MVLTELRKQQIEILRSTFGREKDVLTKKQIKDTIMGEVDPSTGKTYNEPHYFWQKFEKAGRGEYRIPYDLIDGVVSDTDLKKVAKSVASKQPVPKQEVVETGTFESPIKNVVSFIPEVDKNYVKFGTAKHIEQIIKSGVFYPVFITGLSGNGKTLSVEQSCAKLKREMVRVNITLETDEDDLLGGFRLIDGNTKFVKGPVVDAMERGAVLLLDEVDLASNKILALQPVLEGKGVFLKKNNEWVTPKEGFNIIATANTKGKGSESGAFVGTNILNEAFLERFAITLEHEYPPNGSEKRILKNIFDGHGISDDSFVGHLVDWASAIRKTFFEGGTDEIISTRRLVHIANAYHIFGDKEQAIDLCIARFDEDTKETFKEFYKKFDADDVVVEDPSGGSKVSDLDADRIPF